MCPVFLPLPRSPEGGAPGDRHILIQISHNRGCRYYVGRYDTKADKLLPDYHGRMTWEDRSYFAPEAMIDGKGRLLLWTWLVDNPSNDIARAGWTGVLSMPRVLWERSDGSLGIAPPAEFAALRLNERSFGPLDLSTGSARELTGFPGDSFDLELETDAASARSLALEVRASADGSEKTVIRYDAENGQLVFDGTKSGLLGIPTLGYKDWPAHVPVERAPFRLAPGERLCLRVMVDGPVIEVFANGRQAITRRVYPRADSRRVRLIAEKDPARVDVLKVWEMAASNPR